MGVVYSHFPPLILFPQRARLKDHRDIQWGTSPPDLLDALKDKGTNSYLSWEAISGLE